MTRLDQDSIVCFLRDNYSNMGIEEWMRWLEVLPRLGKFSPEFIDQLLEVLHTGSSWILCNKSGEFFDDIEDTEKFCTRLALTIHFLSLTQPTSTSQQPGIITTASKAVKLIIGADPFHRTSVIESALRDLIKTVSRD